MSVSTALPCRISIYEEGGKTIPLASYSEDKTGVNPRLSEENRGWPKNGC
jgi:uncharacterized protein (DUF302 family)